MDVMKIALILCGVAAAELVAQPSICIDPPPRSRNSSLDAVVARAIETLAAPSLSWHTPPVGTPVLFLILYNTFHKKRFMFKFEGHKT